MNNIDAQLGRKLMVDELETVNQYEAMADHASPEVAEVIRDVADEEKVHAGEGAAIVGASDDRAEPAMEEGLQEAARLMNRGIYSPEEVTIIAKSSFGELMNDAFEKARGDKVREAKMATGTPRRNLNRQGAYTTGALTVEDEFREQERRGRQGVRPEGQYEQKRMRNWTYDPKTGLPWPTRDINVAGSEVDRRWVLDAIKRGNLIPVESKGKFLGAYTKDGRFLKPESVVERLEAMGIDRGPETNYDYSRRDLYDFLNTKKDNWAQDIAEEEARRAALPENERPMYDIGPETAVSNRYLDEAEAYFANKWAAEHPDKPRREGIRHISEYFSPEGTVIPYLSYVRSRERMNKERQRDIKEDEESLKTVEETNKEKAIKNSDLYMDLLTDKLSEFMSQGMTKEDAYSAAQKAALTEATRQFEEHRNAIRSEDADFRNRQAQAAQKLEDARAQISATDKLGAAENADVYEPFKAIYSGYDPASLNSLMFTPQQRKTISQVLERFKDMPSEEMEKRYPNLHKYYGEGGLQTERLMPSNKDIKNVVNEWSKVKTGDKVADNKLLGKMLGQAGIRTRNIHAALGDVMSSLNVPSTADTEKLDEVRDKVSQAQTEEQFPVRTSREEKIRDFAMQNKGKSPKELAGLFNDKHGGENLFTTEDEVRILTTPEQEKAKVIEETQSQRVGEAKEKREQKEEARKKQFEEKQKESGDDPSKHQTSDAPPKMIPGGGIEVKEQSNIEKSASFADMLSESIMKKDSEKGVPTMSNDALMRDPYRHVWMTENEPIDKFRNLEVKEDHGEGGSVKTAPKDDGVSGSFDKNALPSFGDMMAERDQ